MSDIKKFLEWIKIKNRLHHQDYNPPEFSEGEVWWCSVGENVGVEISGKNELFSRPVFIFKKLSKKLFLGLPTSTQIQKVKIWFVPITIKDTQTFVLLSQARVFDSKRLIRRIGMVESESIWKVRRAFVRLFL